MFHDADVGSYVLWLSRYVEGGGRVTHYYDYSFDSISRRWLFADLDFTLGGERGSDSRSIICAPGVNFTGSIGHNNVFQYDQEGIPFRSGVITYVPAFNDSIFLSVPTVREAKERFQQEEAQIQKEYLRMSNTESDLSRYTQRHENGWI